MLQTRKIKPECQGGGNQNRLTISVELRGTAELVLTLCWIIILSFLIHCLHQHLISAAYLIFGFTVPNSSELGKEQILWTRTCFDTLISLHVAE